MKYDQELREVFAGSKAAKVASVVGTAMLLFVAIYVVVLLSQAFAYYVAEYGSDVTLHLGLRSPTVWERVLGFVGGLF